MENPQEEGTNLSTASNAWLINSGTTISATTLTFAPSTVCAPSVVGACAVVSAAGLRIAVAAAGDCNGSMPAIVGTS